LYCQTAGPSAVFAELLMFSVEEILRRLDQSCTLLKSSLDAIVIQCYKTNQQFYRTIDGKVGLKHTDLPH
jgi:hypothetical protein